MRFGLIYYFDEEKKKERGKNEEKNEKSTKIFFQTLTVSHS